ncbi:MAG TPA: polysaccharide deacetylase family protein [Sphingomicrobium sp.]|nr:polysaccharide deacetylase family protein [Sphingomicrobium sp.]
MVAAAILAAPLLGVGLLKVSKAKCFVLIGDVLCHASTNEKLVALTFDDGPSQQGLDSVLPLLERHRAKATFFLIGERVTAPLVQRIVEDGHEIGNHSFNHHRMVFRKSSFYDEEIRRTDAVLVAAGAPAPTLFRPPFGKKLIGLPLAVQRSGKRMVMWDSGDPPDRDPKIYAKKVLDQVRPGSIVLIHPMYSANATEREALPLILEGLAKSGYRLVTVSELLRSE